MKVLLGPWRVPGPPLLLLTVSIILLLSIGPAGGKHDGKNWMLLFSMAERTFLL
jgi:hypothetical protein